MEKDLDPAYRIHTGNHQSCSQHTKTAPAPGTPGIDQCAADPQRVQQQERQIRHSGIDYDSAQQAVQPTQHFQHESDLVVCTIIFDPFPDVFYESVHFFSS